jgi:hypothetical protein
MSVAGFGVVALGAAGGAVTAGGPGHVTIEAMATATSGENLTLGARLESDGNSGSHAPDSHASSQMGIPSGIQMLDTIH